MVNESEREHVKRAYKRLRLDAGVTQLEAEARARLPKGRYWKLENGFETPTPEERNALARVFGCDVDQLPSAPSEVVPS